VLSAVGKSLIRRVCCGERVTIGQPRDGVNGVDLGLILVEQPGLFSRSRALLDPAEAFSVIAAITFGFAQPGTRPETWTARPFSVTIFCLRPGS
jgi:hypothetical protein